MVMFVQNCGTERTKDPSEGKVITIIHYLPNDEYQGKDKYIEKLEKAIIQNDAGEMIKTDKSKRAIETTIRIKDQASIDKIKHIILKINPAIEYRIEGI